MSNSIPLLTPILALLRSRKFLVALATLITTLVVAQVPELVTVQGEIITALVTIGLALIGGITLEDAAKAGREAAASRQTDTAHTPEQDLQSLLQTAIDEYFRTTAFPVNASGLDTTPVIQIVPGDTGIPGWYQTRQFTAGGKTYSYSVTSPAKSDG